MDEKPWLTLIPYDNTNWWITSKNLYFPDMLTKLTQNVNAYFIIKDCNSMGTTYYRYFYWLNGSNYRYLNVDNKWCFDEPMCNMKNGSIVVETWTQQKYIVNDKFDNPYVKILEILEIV